MEELKIKLEELNRVSSNLEIVMKDAADKMHTYRKEKNYDKDLYYFNEYSRFKEEKRYVDKKISIISDAMDILEGVGI